jgi:hypothetical protein
MWIDKLDNPEAIMSLFEVPPSLNEVEIISITLSRDGPAMLLAIGLCEPPSKPSRRLQRIKANAVSVKLQLFVVENLRLEGWVTDTRVRLHIGGERGGNITVSAAGPGVTISCSCRFLSVQGVTPYYREKPPVTSPQSPQGQPPK